MRPSADPALLLRHPVIARLLPEFRSVAPPPWVIVGGFVRDWLLERTGERDVDLVVPGDPLPAARGLAAALGGTLVPLDPTTARIVFSHAGERWHLDLARLRARDLEADLWGRDFTIDAMAVEAGPTGVRLLDPAGGRADLQQRVVRATSAAVFREDPLRLLRAVRLAAQLHFRIAEETQHAIRADALRLARASGERIRDELFKIFGCPQAAPLVPLLRDLGLLAPVIPEAAAMERVPASSPHRLPLWEHAVETLRSLEELLVDLRLHLSAQAEGLRQQLREPVEGEITRGALLKVFALLHDVGKPETRTVAPDGRVRFLGHEVRGAEILRRVAGRLRLGRRATDLLVAWERGHLRPIGLAQLPAVSSRARFRFFRDLGEDGVELLLHAVADVRATRGSGSPEAAAQLVLGRELLDYWQGRFRPLRERPLVRGEEVMAQCGLPPGPLVGHLLERLNEAVAGGQVRTRDQALRLLAERADGWREAFEAGAGEDES